MILNKLTDGEVIIDAVVKAAAIENALLLEDDSIVFRWKANAAEQIEAALFNSGFKITRINNYE